MSGRTVNREAPPVFGWDVGGAHVKVSVATAQGRLADVVQWACPLWQGLAHLERVIDEVFARWPSAAAPSARHAVTMTGEMVDLFADRAEGVRQLVHTLTARLGGSARFFAGSDGWLAAQDAIAHWRAVASANWLATAQWVATRMPAALLVDIGSTTTDIVPIVQARVAARGVNDATRLVTGELTYHGVVRTPLCGIAHRIEFRGERTGVMNEWFATSADLYRLTGELGPSHDQHPSADNGPKTIAASCARLARTIGRDASDASIDEWRSLAYRWRREQLRTIGACVEQVSDAHPQLAGAPLVGAGCGRFLAAALAREMERAYVDFSALIDAAVAQPAAAAQHDGADQLPDWIATCAPSVAVALLMTASTGDEPHAALRAGNPVHAA